MTRSRYSAGAIVFHWLIAALIIANIVVVLVTDGMAPSIRVPAITFHKATGITVLVLTVGRILWRIAHRPPPLPPTVRRWEAHLAHAVHWAFYALMIALPLSGWIWMSIGGRKPFSWYGLFGLPLLPLPQDKPLAGSFHEAHEIMGYAMIALIVLHVAGALKHQFFDSRGFLFRMVPGAARAR